MHRDNLRTSLKKKVFLWCSYPQKEFYTVHKVLFLSARLHPHSTLTRDLCSAAVPSFRSCVQSWFFLWHLLWLSLMQLRHYLFIGTLNPTLNRLANNDPTLGKTRTRERESEGGVERYRDTEREREREREPRRPTPRHEIPSAWTEMWLTGKVDGKREEMR